MHDRRDGAYTAQEEGMSTKSKRNSKVTPTARPINESEARATLYTHYTLYTTLA